MALGDPYVSLTELKSYLGIEASDETKNTALQFALDGATREIEDHCERQFNKEAAASQRLFKAGDPYDIEVDDFYDTTGFILETDPNYSGSFSQVWTASDYELTPENGIVGGVPGFPFWEIAAVGGLRFPCHYPGRRRLTVRVTALWGWAEVPKVIRTACFQLATKNFNMASAPLGVAGMGDYVVRVRDIVGLEAKLCRYKRNAVEVG